MSRRAYAVRVRWIAEATIDVIATSEEQAERIARDQGLPWEHATEGDDGGSTTWTVLQAPEDCTHEDQHGEPGVGMVCDYCGQVLDQ